MDAVAVSGHNWRVSDGYLDVAVYEGARYEVWDADELAEGLRAGEISQEEAIEALVALNSLTRFLAANGYSGVTLLERFAPALPR